MRYAKQAYTLKKYVYSKLAEVILLMFLGTVV